jgi:hypothetical protein
MRRPFPRLFAGMLLVILASGCGSGTEKGINRGKDMPKPAESTTKEKGT